MEQKFVKFEEAIEKLGISADQLNELRERGMLRAYRDGASWKFRGDEIQQMMDQGVPEPPPPSDIGLIDEDDLVESEPLELESDELGLADEPDLDGDELELDLAEDEEETSISKDSPVPPLAATDSELEPDLTDTDTLSSGSELEMADLEDTVTADTSDLASDDPPSDPSDSILLSEEELGESVGPRSSTIIGKEEEEDADLELELEDEDDVLAEQSDVKLAGPGESDVLSSKIAGSGVLDTETSDSGGGASAFEDLEELEIDLAAESSRVLSPEEVEEFKSAAQEANQPVEDSDLRLDDGDDDDANMGSTDVPMLELEGDAVTVDEGSGSEIELAGDSDLDLSDSGGSDITLDSGDSGINLVSPSDSGLALDDIPLDIGGSAILSSLSLSGDSDPEISLVGDADGGGGEEGSALQTDEDFQLTPLSEGGADEEGDSSSQVIALDADFDDMGAGAASAVSGFEEVQFTEEAEEAVVLTDEEAEVAVEGFEPSYSAAPGAAAAAAPTEMPYGVSGMLLLMSTTIILTLCSLMLFDVLTNIWTWNQDFSVSSDLMDSLLQWFGLQ